MTECVRLARRRRRTERAERIDDLRLAAWGKSHDVRRILDELRS